MLYPAVGLVWVWPLVLSACHCLPAQQSLVSRSTPCGPACSATQRLRRFEMAQPHMGTTFRIVLYAPDEATANRAAKAGFERIAQLDLIMSDYRDDSELMKLCAQAGGPPVKVSDDLFAVLAKSKEIARQSDGALDVTIGPVVRLWRRARRQRELPDAKRLAEALALVGDDKLRLDEKNRTAQLEKRGMLLDLGGIAKGYAVDEALAVLERQGIASALVAGGGDIAVSDPPPGAEGWRIGILPLDSPDKPPSRFLMLKNAAVSTSGDAEQFVEINGKRYSHIVDPKTGIGLIGHSSVTVVAPKGILSDGLATAASVLNPKRALQMIDATKGTAALILQSVNGKIETFESKRWKDVPKGKE